MVPDRMVPEINVSYVNFIYFLFIDVRTQGTILQNVTEIQERENIRITQTKHSAQSKVITSKYIRYLFSTKIFNDCTDFIIRYIR